MRTQAWALLLGVTMAAAQSPPQAAPLTVSYAGGQLRIEAHGSTLAEVLTRIAAVTGAKVDVPPDAKNERIPALELGPGPARQVTVSLLSDSNFDYLIQGSAGDPEKLDTVLVLIRGKKGSPVHSAGGEEQDVLPAPALPATALETTEESVATPQPVAPERPPEATKPFLPWQPQQSNIPKTMPVPGPAVLNQPSIQQQLQQMYQQRMQMQPLPPAP